MEKVDDLQKNEYRALLSDKSSMAIFRDFR